MNDLNENGMTTYDIVIRGSGGDFTLGQITTEAANYWSTLSQEELLLHLSCPEEEDIGPSEAQYRLEDYRDSANLAYEIGFDEIDKVKIYSASGEQLIGWYGESLNVKSVSLEHQCRIDGLEGCSLFTRTMDEGHLCYTVNTRGEFDFRKLSFTKVIINGESIFNDVVYDGKTLEIEDYFERVGVLKAEILFN